MACSVGQELLLTKLKQIGLMVVDLVFVLVSDFYHLIIFLEN